MANTDNIEGLAQLAFLRAVRNLNVYVTPDEVPGWSGAAQFVAPVLVSRGLLHQRFGGKVQTTAEADRLLERIDEVGRELLAEFELCGYTHSHTRAWCGNPYCRES